MKKLIIAILLLVSVQFIWAQDNGLSLKHAIQTALDNRYDLQIGKVNTQISENEIKKINARDLPQITSDLDWRYNTQLQTNMLPVGVIINDPTLPDRPVQFGTKFNTALGFNLNQNIFNPVNKGDKKIAQAQIGYDQLSEKVTENQIKLEVTEGYFNVLIWKEKVQLSLDNAQRTQAIYNTAKKQYKNGTITANDLKRYEIDYENANAAYVKDQNSLGLAMNDLWYKIGVEPVESAVLSDTIEQLFLEHSTIGLEGQLLERPELEMEKQQQEIYQQHIKKQNLSYWPTISLTGNYTFQFLHNEYRPFQSEYWFPYNFLGVKASIPIFDGFLKERTKNEYRLRIQSSQLNLAKLKMDFGQDSKNAITSFKNAQADITYQQKNLELVNSLYTSDQNKLAKGTITPNDLATTYYTLQQTQNNYLDAMYVYLMAVVQYKQAIGDL
jgi:outer membrane protein